MELGVNYKGKKNPPASVKKPKASRNQPPSVNKSNLSKPKQKSVSPEKKTAKSNHRKSFLGIFAQTNSKSKRSLAAKSKTTAQSGNSPKIQRNLKEIKPKPKLSLLLAVYAVTIIVGLSTILGTSIEIASSFQTPNSQQKTALNAQKTNNSANKLKLQQLLAFSALNQEINPLKVKIEELAQKYPDLKPEVFLVDLDTKGFVSIGSKDEIASASTIKLPILVAFFQDLDQGKIQLEEQLTMTKELMAGGSGNMQHQKVGTKFSALETVEQMIVISDNTATNILVERLGGKSALNQRFISMGLNKTTLRNPLPDLMGTNTTSAEDLGNLLIKINNGELLSLRSRDRFLHIMSNVERDTLLPQGLETGALIAHKTGDIKSVLGDVGMIDMPNGKRYIASMLIKRPDNSLQAQEFIQKASGVAYQYFKSPQTTSFALEETKNKP
jgi:beta-lactamase class A